MNEASERPDIAAEIDGDFTRTRSGNIAPESEECAKEVLSLLFTNEIQVGELSGYGVSNKAVYGYFDGVEHAEEEVFGLQDTYACETCGREFSERNGYKRHRSICTEERSSTINRVDSLIGLRDSDCEYDIYRLKVEHICDGEEYWYIGRSNSLRERLRYHLSGDDNKIAFPHGGELYSCPDYEVAGFEVVDGCDTPAEASELERQYFLKTAREKDTQRVLGGK